MWPFKSTLRTEDPERLRRFISQLENLNWDSSTTALSFVYAALNDLVYHEVLFYYKARKKGRRISVWTRVLAVFFGTAGVMIPLLAAADNELFKPISPYGYPCLAAAAAWLAINRMFGATGGHIRYVTTQLELERIMTKFRLQWLEWCSRDTMTPGNPATPEQAFKLMNDFANDAYRVIQEETLSWGKSTTESMGQYEAGLPKSPGSTDRK